MWTLIASVCVWINKCISEVSRLSEETGGESGGRISHTYVIIRLVHNEQRLKHEAKSCSSSNGHLRLQNESIPKDPHVKITGCKKYGRSLCDVTQSGRLRASPDSRLILNGKRGGAEAAEWRLVAQTSHLAANDLSLSAAASLIMQNFKP